MSTLVRFTKVRTFFSVAIASMVLLLGFAMSAHATYDDEPQCYRGAVTSLDIVESGMSGRSKLCVSDDDLKGVMKIKGLTPGHAYTVWWVYVDQPECVGGIGFFECVGTFFGSDPLAVFGRMDSAISDHSGKVRFVDRLDDMRVRSGSQVWLLAFGHGPASKDGRQLARQLLTPEDPNAGAPHLGVEGNGYPVAITLFEIK